MCVARNCLFTSCLHAFVPSCLSLTCLPQKRSCQVAAEALAGAERVVGAQPGGRGAEADGGQRARDLPDGQLGIKGIDDGSVSRPVDGLVDGASEDPPCQRALPAAGGANDQADLPRLRKIRELDPEVPWRRSFDGKIEHPRDLPYAEAVADRAVELEFVDRHSDRDHAAFASAGGEILVKPALIALVGAVHQELESLYCPGGGSRLPRGTGFQPVRATRIKRRFHVRNKRIAFRTG